MSSIFFLPAEMLLRVFSFCDPEDGKNFSLVSRTWKAVSETFFYHLCKAEFWQYKDVREESSLRLDSSWKKRWFAVTYYFPEACTSGQISLKCFYDQGLTFPRGSEGFYQDEVILVDINAVPEVVYDEGIHREIHRDRAEFISGQRSLYRCNYLTHQKRALNCDIKGVILSIYSAGHHLAIACRDCLITYDLESDREINRFFTLAGDGIQFYNGNLLGNDYKSRYEVVQKGRFLSSYDRTNYECLDFTGTFNASRAADHFIINPQPIPRSWWELFRNFFNESLERLRNALPG